MDSFSNSNFIKSFRIQKGVISALLLRELKTRFSENRLGYFWVLLEPMIHLVVLLLIFAFLKSRMVPQVPFELFLLTGLVPYFLFKNITLQVMDSINSNKALFAYKNVMPLDTFIARVILEVLIYSAVFALLLFGLHLFGFYVLPYRVLEMILVFGLLVLFSFSLGLCLAILGQVFEPTRYIFKIIMRPMYFLSAIMYPLWIIPSDYVHYLLYNPIIHLIEPFREAFFAHYPVTHGVTLWYPFCLTVGLLFVGLWFYNKRKYHLKVTI